VLIENTNHLHCKIQSANSAYGNPPFLLLQSKEIKAISGKNTEFLRVKVGCTHIKHVALNPTSDKQHDCCMIILITIILI
jgi:hypothetical protein